MLPEIAKLEFETQEIALTSEVHSTFAWDFDTGDFELLDGRLVPVTGLEYIKIWVDKILRTRSDLEIYTIYGSGHHDLIGSVYEHDFVKAELTRMIQEALLTNPAITGLDEVAIRFDGSELDVTFIIKTIYGTTEVSL